MEVRGVDTTRLASLSLLCVILVAIVILAWSLARMVWVILAEPGHDIPMTGVGSIRAAESVSSDFGLLERLTPFPRTINAGRESDSAVIDAPETSLDLVLHGVLMRADSGGVAYISVGEAAQKSYRVGDTIDAAGGVLVRRILPEAVILERDGQQERLASARPGGSASEGIVTLRDGQRPDATPPETPTPDKKPVGEMVIPSDQEPARARATISRTEMEELAQSIRFDDRTGGVDGGFSVFPTRRAELFAGAGLKSGDVIQEVGGIRLDTVSDFEKVFADLETQTQIDVRLVRQGKPRLLTLQLRDERSAPEGD